MGKRSNGEGHYSKLPSGSWRCQIMDGYKPDGKPKMISFTAPTKSEAKQKVREYLINKSLAVVNLKTIDFSTLADSWYADYETQVQASTYDNYKYTLNTLKQHFGTTNINEIKQLHINAFLTKLLNANASLSKVTKCKAMLIQIFTFAVENEFISHNPAEHSKAIRDVNEEFEEDEPSKKDAFTKEEISLLKNDLPNNLTGNSILLMIGTGIRVQELLALTPSDISEDGSSINITKAIKMVGGVPQLGPPKSKRSRRVVPVPEDYRKNAIYLRSHGGKQRIWTSEREDGLYAVKVFRTKYYKALSLIPGVRMLSPHCCRHTYITNLQAEGISVELIARLAGHSKISTTDKYAHTSIDTLANVVESLNERKEN